MIKKGSKVLIRTHSAGVHFGTLISRKGKEVHLSNAKRLWSWQGALSLSEIATKGLNLSASRISVPVEEIILPETIEIIPISKSSNLPCD
jgi:hypothetical protein